MQVPLSSQAGEAECVCVPTSSSYLQAAPINCKIDMVMTSCMPCESKLKRERSLGAGISREGLQNKVGCGSLSRWLSFSGIEKKGLAWPVWPVSGEKAGEPQS